LQTAETLGVDYDRVRPIVADTASVGYTHVTGGSRVTFATGTAVVDATKKVVQPQKTSQCIGGHTGD
jgi:CO/xanthine dehydrogenase Mo-binding subunit